MSNFDFFSYNIYLCFMWIISYNDIFDISVMTIYIFGPYFLPWPLFCPIFGKFFCFHSYGNFPILGHFLGHGPFFWAICTLYLFLFSFLFLPV